MRVHIRDPAQESTVSSMPDMRDKFRDVQDTPARGGEEDEEPDVEEHRDDRAAQLRNELVARLRAQEVPSFQVTYVQSVSQINGRSERGCTPVMSVDCAAEPAAMMPAVKFTVCAGACARPAPFEIPPNTN